VKTANVIEVRPVRAPANLDPAYTNHRQRERADQLLGLYPEISPEEVLELVNFLSEGMHLDVGLLSARDEYKPKIAEIRAAHPAAFRLGWSYIAIFVFVILTPLALMALLPFILGRA
jgi:hypothetical protein